MARDRNRDEDERDEPRPRRPRDDDEGVTDAPLARRRRAEEDDYDDEPRRRRRRRRDDDGPQMNPEDLRTVAKSQRAICLCILGYLATIPLRLGINALPDQNMQLVGALCLLVFYLIVAITATVFVFMMAVKVYSTGMGVFLGILTMVPCIGIFVLLIINSKATGILKRHGVRVGLLGADMSDLP